MKRARVIPRSQWLARQRRRPYDGYIVCTVNFPNSAYNDMPDAVPFTTWLARFIV